jgi:Heterokaryon incompatibility protein (HET)
MWLLHTSTLRLEEFSGVDIPQYAILSHRWEEEGEVTLQNFQNRKRVETDWFSKIKGCSAQALSDSWDYIWIDCCSIDRSDDTELSESINCMLRWYSGAQVCYVYLSDITGCQTWGRP